MELAIDEKTGVYIGLVEILEDGIENFRKEERSLTHGSMAVGRRDTMIKNLLKKVDFGIMPPLTSESITLPPVISVGGTMGAIHAIFTSYEYRK